MVNDLKDQKEKILQLMQEAVKQDSDLRDQYKIGDKFRFIRDRLSALMARVDENLTAIKKATEQKTNALSEDEVLVYVYLFNAQGLVLKTWQKMVSPSVLYEYSVNRPVYADKALIESVIRSKSNKAQHGYLTIAIKKDDITKPPEGVELKDALGNPVIKVKEGSLRFEKLFSFTHNNIEYISKGETGELVKKEPT